MSALLIAAAPSPEAKTQPNRLPPRSRNALHIGRRISRGCGLPAAQANGTDVLCGRSPAPRSSCVMLRLSPYSAGNCSRACGYDESASGAPEGETDCFEIGGANVAPSRISTETSPPHLGTCPPAAEDRSFQLSVPLVALMDHAEHRSPLSPDRNASWAAWS
jgi:hypothetical protein